MLLIHINRTTNQNQSSCTALGWPGWPSRVPIRKGSSWSKSMYSELMVKLKTHKKNIFGPVKGIKCWSLIAIPKLDITCQHSASLRVIACCKEKKEMISEILIRLYGTKHQLFHRWNMICVWNTPLQLESLNGAYSCSQSSKTREPHLLQSLQTGSYKYSSSDFNEVLDALLTPQMTDGILCGFCHFRAKVNFKSCSHGKYI